MVTYVVASKANNPYLAECQIVGEYLELNTSDVHVKSVIKDNHNVAIIHAEQNTITDCAKRGVSSDGCCAYITHRPCYNCMKLMVSSGIKQIKYICDLSIYDIKHIIILGI